MDKSNNDDIIVPAAASLRTETTNEVNQVSEKTDLNNNNNRLVENRDKAVFPEATSNNDNDNDGTARDGIAVGGQGGSATATTTANNNATSVSNATTITTTAAAVARADPTNNERFDLTTMEGLKHRVVQLEKLLHEEKQSKMDVQDRLQHSEQQLTLCSMDNDRKMARLIKIHQEEKKQLDLSLEVEKGKSSNRELTKVQTKLDETKKELQDYKTKSKNMEKELKKKDKTIQRITNSNSKSNNKKGTAAAGRGGDGGGGPQRKRRRSTNVSEGEQQQRQSDSNMGTTSNNEDGGNGRNNSGNSAKKRTTTATACGNGAAATVTASAAQPPPPKKRRGKHDLVWQRHFDELQKFYNDNGHSNLPMNYPQNKELAVWVSTQRTQYRFYKMGDFTKTTISMDRIQKLKSIGFCFSVIPPPRNWDDRYRDLVSYQKSNGHCNVPQKFSGGLGEFVMNCRRKYRKGILSDEKVQLMESIGFQWSLRNRGGTLEDRMIAFQQQQVEGSIDPEIPLRLRAKIQQQRAQNQEEQQTQQQQNQNQQALRQQQQQQQNETRELHN